MTKPTSIETFRAQLRAFREHARKLKATLLEHMPGRPGLNIVVTWIRPIVYKSEGYAGAWAFEWPALEDGYFYFRLLGLEVSVW